MAKEAAEKERKVPAIDEGTVIDHIPSRMTLKVLKILDLHEYEHPVTIGFNLGSKKLGKKGIIKISGRKLSEEEFNKVALLAPNATVNIIKDYEVKEKIHVKMPEEIKNIVKCSNPKCITNFEEVKTKFLLVRGEPLRIRCVYCEKAMGRDDIVLN